MSAVIFSPRRFISRKSFIEIASRSVNRTTLLESSSRASNSRTVFVCRGRTRSGRISASGAGQTDGNASADAANADFRVVNLHLAEIQEVEVDLARNIACMMARRGQATSSIRVNFFSKIYRIAFVIELNNRIQKFFRAGLTIHRFCFVNCRRKKSAARRRQD